MTLSTDRATVVFKSSFRKHLSSIFILFGVINAFSVVGNGGMLISAAREF